jgi:hypothetical protein
LLEIETLACEAMAELTGRAMAVGDSDIAETSLLESHSISVVISRLGEKKAIIPHFVDESMLLSDPSGPNTRAKVSERLGFS